MGEDPDWWRRAYASFQHRPQASAHPRRTGLSLEELEARDAENKRIFDVVIPWCNRKLKPRGLRLELNREFGIGNGGRFLLKNGEGKIITNDVDVDHLAARLSVVR